MHDNELIKAVEHEDHKLVDKEADIANTIGKHIFETKDNQSWLQNIKFLSQSSHYIVSQAPAQALFMST